MSIGARWRASLVTVGVALSVYVMVTASRSPVQTSRTFFAHEAESEMALVDWHPPLGIPAPEFGIFEAAPLAPDPWESPVPGFYYVSPSAVGATDRGNPFGTPSRPRASIPMSLPPGAVVEVRGVYDRDHGGRNRIVSHGTPTQPVFLRGSGEDAKTDVVRYWEVSGQYVVLEHLRFRALDQTTTGGLVFVAPTDHAALRHSEVSGNLNAGGLGIENWSMMGAFSTRHVVVWSNRVHDNGDVAADYDQDRHGIHVGDGVDHVWVIDNEMYRNSGDGIQINAGSASAQPTTHHIYVGRNVSHHNKQNGFWTKQAVDVIFSQNVAYAHRPSNSSMGVGLGYQYAPDYVWFLFNHVYDSDYGIGTGSDADLGTGTESFFIGNLIHDIHDSNGDFQAQSAWHNCAISLPGGVNRYVVNNTMYGVDSGVCMPSPFGKVEIHNNIVYDVRPDGQHIFLEFFASAAASAAAGNVFGPTYRALTAGTQHRHDDEAIAATGGNAVVRNLHLAREAVPPIDVSVPTPFVGDPQAEPEVQARPGLTASDLFDLLPASVAVDFGIDDPAGVYERFSERYGLDIRWDFLGRPRPNGQAMDAGAFESPYTRAHPQ